MSPNVSLPILAAAAALAFGVLSSPVQAQEVSGVKVTAEAPTSIRINVTGLAVPAVRHQVRAAAVRVCSNAVSNRQLDYFDGEWCRAATTDKTMVLYRRLHAQWLRQVATGPQVLLIAAR